MDTTSISFNTAKKASTAKETFCPGGPQTKETTFESLVKARSGNKPNIINISINISESELNPEPVTRANSFKKVVKECLKSMANTAKRCFIGVNARPQRNINQIPAQQEASVKFEQAATNGYNKGKGEEYFENLAVKMGMMLDDSE